MRKVSPLRRPAAGYCATPRTLLAQVEALYTAAVDSSEAVRGTLSLGCLVSLAPIIGPELSTAFMAAHPSVAIRQQEGHQERLFGGLRRAEIDIAITFDFQIPEDVAFEPLAALQPHVLVGDSHPFARRTSVSLAEIAAEPLILIDLEGSREYILMLFMKNKLAPNIRARSSNIEMVRSMVANGYGYTITDVRPRSDIALDGRRLVRLKFVDHQPPLRLGIIKLTQIKPLKLVTVFEKFCRIHISDSTIPGMASPM